MLAIPAASLKVAYSGGLDSTLLLHLACLVCRWRGQPLPVAIHVHHGLSPNADAWVRHCEAQCRILGVSLLVRKVTLIPGGKGTENAARTARYQVFEQLLDEGEVLLQGHHLDDQAETLLLRLMRGAGVEGLAGIPRTRALGAGAIYRPLLDLSRALLERVARAMDLSWIQDESNASLEYDRNFLRHEILPRLEQRWPAARRRLAASAGHCREAAEQVQRLATEDLAAVRCTGKPYRLDIPALMQLSTARQNAVLRLWLGQHDLPLATEKLLAEIHQSLIAAEASAAPEIHWQQTAIRRFRQQLCLVPQSLVPQTRLGAPSKNPAQGLVVDVRSSAAISWAGQWWRVTQIASVDKSSSGADTRNSPLWLRLPRPGELIQLQARCGGERLSLPGDSHRRSLKHWFQSHAVPPWERNRAPLIYFDRQLAALAGLVVCEGYQAQPGEPGWQLVVTATEQVDQ